MGGGSLQLSAIGKENNYLTINPQISFFKAVYNHYSNFAMQNIRLNFNTIDSLSYDSDTKIKVKLEKNAELINTVFFEIKLPKVLASRNTDSEKFYWIDKLGSSIIKSGRILIGGEIIEEYTGEYMYIYHKNSLETEKNKIYNDITKNNINSFNDYRCYTDTESFQENGNTYYNKSYKSIPSYSNDTIRIPLPFWFHRNIGLSLPIFTLEYHDVILELTLRPIKELCLIMTSNSQTESVEFLAANSKNDSNVVSNNMSNIFHRQLKTPTELGYNESDITKYFENNRWTIEPHVDVNYIFISENDKKLFKKGSLEYIVEPINNIALNSVNGKISYRDILKHPVKEIYIVGQRDDVNKRNCWLNFGNNDDNMEINYGDYQNNFYRISKIESDTNNNIKPPIYYLGGFTSDVNQTDLKLIDSEWNSLTNDMFIEGENCYKSQDIQNFLDIWKYRDYKYIPYIDRQNNNFYTDDIIKNVEIFLDQVERVNKREGLYFNKIEPFLCGLNSVENVLLYSFSLEPNNYQPSGKCNFSHIKDVTFNIELKDTSFLSSNYTYKYNVNIYTKYYNILQIRFGMADLIFKD